MRIKTIAGLAVLLSGLAPAIALADEHVETAAEEMPAAHEFPLGTRTSDYLDRQRSGEESSNAHGLTPPAERRARKRYLQSFEHPIPNLFDTEEPKAK